VPGISHQPLDHTMLEGDRMRTGNTLLPRYNPVSIFSQGLFGLLGLRSVGFNEALPE
jgi:hypothetical protein